ncbi:hypothetical protein BGX28_007760 [Mortierella sp. GBA30]|nr:hypothetical protein BGX28_007760 [Mortierella sp. GBA30]
MMMHNSPLFVITWLALLKIAVIPAFINNQINGPVLIHSLKVADAKLLLFDYELVEAVQGSLQEIKELGYDIYTVTPKQEVLGQAYVHLPKDARQALDHAPSFFGYVEWQHLSAAGFPKEFRRHVTLSDPVALIYTSGTTGFPKAAVMDHGRCTMATSSWGWLCEINPEDKVYITLPLYHSAGSILGVGQSWTTGCTIVLARKFSVKKFWHDCIENDVTHFQYIGELCRYLLNAPETPLDKKHKVRMAFGNGMRPDVWAKFQERFNIPIVFEYYTMSEGTGALLNVAKNRRDQGAVGFRGPIVRLLKVDFDTEELIRDEKTGFCIQCQPGEIGELVTQADNKQPHTRYVGYFNQPKLSNSRLIKDVVEKDDIYFRTGDLLYRSKDQYWYFADRAGDTYRWKGENVSTAEIADTIGRVSGVASCTVYGVSVPGMDGRAGMAALVLKESIVKTVGENRRTCEVDEAALNAFLKCLSEDVAKTLPAYAIPRFLRIAEQELETTGTFKNKKVELKKEGFDLDKVKERMYWWTPQGAKRMILNLLATALVLCILGVLFLLIAYVILSLACSIAFTTRNIRISTSDGLQLGAWHILPKDTPRTTLEHIYAYEPLLPRQRKNSDVGRSSTEVVLDERIEAIFEEALKCADKVVLYFHGQVGDRGKSNRISTYKGIQEAMPSAHVITIDCRGYGDSDGFPSELGFKIDAFAAWLWVTERVACEKVVIYGHSLGSGIATNLCLQLEEQQLAPLALVLDAAFTSMPDMMTAYRKIPIVRPFARFPFLLNHFKLRLLDRFETVRAVETIKSALLLIHGQDDADVLISNSHTLFHTALTARRLESCTKELAVTEAGEAASAEDELARAGLELTFQVSRSTSREVNDSQLISRSARSQQEQEQEQEQETNSRRGGDSLKESPTSFDGDSGIGSESASGNNDPFAALPRQPVKEDVHVSYRHESGGHGQCHTVQLDFPREGSLEYNQEYQIGFLTVEYAVHNTCMDFEITKEVLGTFLRSAEHRRAVFGNHGHGNTSSDIDRMGGMEYDLAKVLCRDKIGYVDQGEVPEVVE